MRFRILAGLICLFLSVGLFAQQTVDHLWKRVQTSRRTGDLQSLANDFAQLGYYYINHGLYDSSIIYYKKSLALEKAVPNISLLASNLNALASAHSLLGHADSSIYYYQQALIVYTTVKDTLHTAVIETNLSILYKNIALYDKSLEYAFRAIKRHEQLQGWVNLGSSYNTVSLVYLKIRDHSNALKYAYKALEARTRVNHVKGVGLSYNNIGEIYLAMANYDSAIANLNRAMIVKRKANDRKSLSTTLTNLGSAMYHLQRMKEAERLFEESLALRIEFKDRAGEANCYTSLARLALHYRNIAKAENLLNKAEEILENTHAPEVRREYIEARIAFSEATRNFSDALHYLRELMVIKDSLLTGEKIESMNALQIEYETEKKEQQILLLQEQSQVKTAELRAKQAMIYGLSAGVCLLAVIGALVYKNFRLARKGKLRQELLNKELNHRVKNNLQLLGSVLSLQSQDLTEAAAVTVVKSNEGRVNAMAIIHRKLYQRENSRSIEMGGYIRELVDFLLYSYSYRTDDIAVKLNVEEIEIDVDKAIPIGLILNELISNALKYAFHGQRDPAVEVSLKTMGTDLLLRVSDNGSGFDSSKMGVGEQSFGLKMIHILTKEMKGAIRFETADGTAVFLKVPAK
jgi:two-component system, sensor histidine kinase PdtaS